MQTETFIQQSRPFIQWMLEWKAGLRPVSLSELVSGQPEKVGIVSVDVIKGFCSVGPLASPRVNRIIEPITRLFEAAWQCGIRDIALTQDAHPEDAVEFAQYGPHCIRGTEEAETVEEFKQLAFFDQLTVIKKNSIASSMTDEFQAWLDARKHIQTWITVGDCTDLCTHQLAMHLRLRANQDQRHDVRVVLPVNTVDTYDLPVDAAKKIGAVPHDGEFMHVTFLYHMMLNGVEVVSEITD
jgi:nicotinamidase-related amidase